MSGQPEARRGRRVVGLVGAACAACCAGPLLVAVGGIGVLATFLWPAVGLAIAAAAVAVISVRRRHHHRAGPGPVPVELASRRHDEAGPSPRIRLSSPTGTAPTSERDDVER